MNCIARSLSICFVLLTVRIGLSQQNVTILARPGTGYVLDNAQLLGPGDIATINSIASTSQSRSQAPIVVVTVTSLASIGAHDADWYATTLFNAWAIGDRRTNRGILLFVARDDRRARIELGAGWGYSRDADCQTIMDSWIIPHFKNSDYAQGIVSGVQALDEMVRTGKVPRRPIPIWVWPGAGGLGTFLFFLIRELIKNGMNGWGGNFLRGLGRFAVHVLSSSGNSSGSRSGGGGFSGGGSSGGGGASGSW